jgi:hypothetical protein
MRIAIFSTKPHEKHFFEEANRRLEDTYVSRASHELGFFETRLTAESETPANCHVLST